MKSYIPIITDYTFSNRELEKYDFHERLLLDFWIDTVTTHGAGGKVIEQVNDHKFGFTPWSDKINGWDSQHQNGRPIEQKMETVNQTLKLQFRSSWSRHTDGKIIKADAIKEENVYILNTAICDKTGKALWVSITDPSKLPDECLFWKRLQTKTPRLSFASYHDYPETVQFLYVNKQLCRKYKDPDNHKARCISKDVYELLEQRQEI